MPVIWEGICKIHRQFQHTVNVLGYNFKFSASIHDFAQGRRVKSGTNAENSNGALDKHAENSNSVIGPCLISILLS